MALNNGLGSSLLLKVDNQKLSYIPIPRITNNSTSPVKKDPRSTTYFNDKSDRVNLIGITASFQSGRKENEYTQRFK